MSPYRLVAERSRALHIAVAQRIASDPSVLEDARERVRSWLTDGTVAPAYASAWAGVLALPPDELGAALAEDSERMHDLRQVSPFAGAIDARTRWRIRDEVRERLSNEAR